MSYEQILCIPVLVTGFISIADKHNHSLSEFRKSVCIENGAQDILIGSQSKWEPINQTFGHLNISARHELYKYSESKWNRTQFAQIEAFEVNGEICSISGCQIMKQWLRIGMHHYSLKKYRHQYRAFMYRKNGFFSRHLAFAKKNSLKGLFFSVHAHNSRLSAYIKNLKEKRFSPESEDILYIKDVRHLENTVVFNGVTQNIFYYPIDETQVFSEELLN